MRNLWVSSLAWALLTASVVGQSVNVATKDVSWGNNSGAGTPVLAASVYYPAIASLPNAAILPATTGYPVVVFMHGWGRLGSDYYRLGQELASSGVVAVMMNTALYSYTEMEHDTRAMFAALGAANIADGGFFSGTLDMSRVGLLGHSMGGAVISHVLNDARNAPTNNPGYKCALALAPANPAIVFSGSEVRVPIGLVSGLGDRLTPPASHAIPYYNALVPAAGLKFHYRMNGNCTHMNLAGLDSAHPAVFDRTKKIMKGFFGQFLNSSAHGLEPVLGVEGMGDPNLVGVDMDSVVPQAWVASELRIGMTSRVSVVAESGLAGLIMANSVALPTSTLVGTLLLDSASAFTVAEAFIMGERFDVIITVPMIQELVGVSFAVQGGGATLNSAFSLGSAATFTIGN